MATDNLTLKFQEELEKRSKAGSANQPPALQRLPASGTGSLWNSLGREELDTGVGGPDYWGPAKLFGAGLWQFADTWTFGAAGLVDDRLLGGIVEDTMYDEESAWAKWGGSVGGLIGFVGNPMKVGFKAAGYVPKLFRLGGKSTKYMPDVAKAMHKRGVAAGLSRKQSKQVVQHYKNLAQQAKYNPDVAAKWSKHSKGLLDNMLQNGLGKGQLTATEAAAVREMFAGNMGRRPVSDLVDIVMKSGKFKDPRKAFVVGSMINEAVAFGLIDAVFETTRSIKEGEAYDWTAPIWGAGVGAGFGALKWLPPAGKATETFDWKKGDFTQGLKTLFLGDRARFTKFKDKELYGIAEGHAEMLSNYGNKAFRKKAPWQKDMTEPWIVQVPYKGTKIGKETMWINLKQASQYKKYNHLSGGAAESMVRDALSKSTRQLGKELIEGSLRGEAKSMAANWHRMIGGSIIMNARTFHHMYQGQEMDVHDVLPHVLIGAWVNRRGNPSSWDMQNGARMEQIRGNLQYLGFNMPNMRQLPDFNPGVPSYLNPIYTETRFESLISDLRDRQHITDSVDTAFAPRMTKAEGEQSVLMSNNNTARIYKVLWNYSTGLNKHQRPQDDIPMSDARAVVSTLKKTAKEMGREIKNEKDAIEFFEEVADKSTKTIENEFIRVAEESANVTGKFSINKRNMSETKIPDFELSPNLHERLEELAATEGKAALEDGHNTVAKINTIHDILRNTNKADPYSGDSVYVETAEQLVGLKELVSSVEGKLSMGLPNKQRFDILDSAIHVNRVMMHNYVRESLNNLNDLFDRSHVKHGDLKMQVAGVLFGARGDLVKMKMIPDASARHLEITNVPESDPGAHNARRVIGGLVEILGAKGQYQLLSTKDKKPGDKGWEPYTSIDYSKVKQIKEFLNRQGLMTSENTLTPFQDELIFTILRERVRDSSLNPSDVGSLNNLTFLGYADFTEFAAGKAAGWYVRKVDVPTAGKGASDGEAFEQSNSKMYNLAQEYNNNIDKLIKRSTTFNKKGVAVGSLVKLMDDKVVVKAEELIALNHALKDPSWKKDTREMLNNFLNSLDTQRFGNYRQQMHDFISRGAGINAVKLSAMMETAGLLRRNKRGDLEMIEEDGANKTYEMMANTNVMKKLSKRMEIEGGMSIKEVESNIENIGREIEASMTGFDTHRVGSQMTVAKFFSKFKVNDGPNADYQAQKDYLNNILFDENNNVIPGGVKRLVDNIEVTHNGKPKLIGKFKGKSYNNRVQEVLPSIINLLSTRSQSKELIHLRFEDGSIREDKAMVMDHGPLKDLADINIKPIYVSGSVDMLVPSPFGSGTARKHLTVFESKADIQTDMRDQLQIHYDRFVDRLEKVNVLGSDTESPMGNLGGLVLFRLGTDHTPFAVPKSDLNNLVNAYSRFMVKLDSAISSKKIAVDSNTYGNLDKLRMVLKGGELKAGDKVYWKDAETGQSLTYHEFTVQGINPNDRTLIKLQMDREMDLSRIIDKENLAAIEKAVTEGVPRENLESVSGDKIPSNQDYQSAMRYWTTYKWLVGKSGNWSKFEEIFASPDAEKMLSRYRLYETKNFSRQQLHLFDNIPLNAEQKRLLEKFADKGNEANVVLWDDKSMYDVKDGMISQLAAYKLKWESILGNRSSDSEFDSIAFTTRDILKYKSFVHGFKNWQTQSMLKPVVSANGKTVLFGKTLFIADPYLEPMLVKNNIDIFLTETGSKIYSDDWNVFSRESKITNKTRIGKQYINKISLDEIGIKSENYEELDLAKRSVSNYNYMSFNESANVFNREFKQPLDRAMESVNVALKSHIHTNSFLRKSYPEEDAIESMIAGESKSTAKLGATRLYNEISTIANPMEIGERMVFNRLYKHYIDPIINAKSVVWGEHGYLKSSEGRYGGKSVFVQSLNPRYRNMKGTIVDEKGVLHQVGEVFLPNSDRVSPLSELLKNGYEMRFVDQSTQKIVGPEQVFGIDFFNESVNNGWRLGDVHDFLKEVNSINAQRTKPDYVVAHKNGDHKWVFLEGSESFNKAIKEGIIERHKDGSYKISRSRSRGKEYRKRAKETGKMTKMYDVFVDMVEHSTLINPSDKSKVDIWIAKDEAEAKAQFDNIRSHGGINFLGMEKFKPGAGEFTVSVMHNRYPRTRPNDVTYLSLKGFLDKQMGNALIANPYDVLNVFEGDYDVDRGDYYFMQTKTMADHVVKNMNNRWVQGIEPNPSDDNAVKLTLAQNDPFNEARLFERAIANSLVHSKARGIGQTMPRLLNHMSHLSIKATPKMIKEDPELKSLDDKLGGKLAGKHIFIDRPASGLFPQRRIIVLDYDGNNTHHRLALEAQTMLDAGAKETTVFSDIKHWKNETLFGEDINAMSTMSDFKTGFDVQKISNGEIGRPRVFRKFYIGRDKVTEDALNVVEKELIKEVMSNHGRFLQLIPGVFEKTGERKSPSYEQIWDRSETYFNFFQNTGRSLYYRLKNNRAIKQDGQGIQQLNSMFGPDRFVKLAKRWKYEEVGLNERTGLMDYVLTKKAEKQGEKFDKRDFYMRNSRDPWSYEARQNYRDLHRKMYEGESGHVVDRIFHRIYQNDIFADKIIEPKLTGDERTELDDHIARFMYEGDLSTADKRTAAMNTYVQNVKGTVADVNRQTRMIPKLKRQWAKIKRMKETYTFDADMKQSLLDGINLSIKTIENDYGSFLTKSYWLKRAGKDIGPGIKYRDIHRDKDLREGAIQYYTLRALANIDWNSTYGAKNKELNDHLTLLRKLEQRYFSDWAGGEPGKTTFKFGPWETLLGKSERQYLQKFVDRNTFEEVRDEILQEGIDRFGWGYLYRYAQPSLNKMTVGVFQGVPIPVPFTSSWRYKVMLNWMAKEAAANEGSSYNHAKITLDRLATTSDRFRNLLEDRTEMIPGVNPNYETLKETVGMADKVFYNDVGWANLQIPGLHRDFVRAYNRYSSVRFDLNKRSHSNPILLSNDHVINFYNDLFAASGLKNQFKTYLDKMSAVTALEIEGRLIDPMSYLATLNNIEVDIIPKLNKVLEDGNLNITAGSNEARRLRQNPLWSALGGSKYILGSRMSFDPVQRLSKNELDIVRMFIKQGRQIKEQTVMHETQDKIVREWRCKPGARSE